MKAWVPLALGCVILAAYAYIYQLAALTGASSVGMTNFAGLVIVFVGIIAAGLVLRRATPP